jgi:4a-hydroxytetrahydrobiopterin dehydratase
MSEPTTSLVSKSCTPCRGGIPPLTPEEVDEQHRQTPAWDIRDDSHRIERTFRFKTFAEAFAFVQRVADLAEAEGHHPDVCFGWGYATVSLQTKKIKGLHENDFIIAAKLDHMADAPGSAGQT